MLYPFEKVTFYGIYLYLNILKIELALDDACDISSLYHDGWLTLQMINAPVMRAYFISVLHFQFRM